MSTAAALAVLIIISAVLLVRGYNQGLTPAVSSSVPLTDQNWPVYQPIKIQFTKPMDHASVENNLQIWPPGERSRIPMSWDNNTLILGSSTSQSTLFLPDTTYQVVVLATAKDSYGNPLGKTFSLSFRTSPIVDTAKDSTPTPQPTPNASPTPGTGQDPAIAQQSTVPSSSVITPPSQSTPQNVVPTATATATPIPPATPTAPAAIATSPSSVVNTPVPTPTQQPTAAATTPTPSPVATPTETPAATVQPAATPTTADLAPVATPVATATAASGTPTASVIPVTGAFGSVYWAFTDVQTKLGAPLSPEAAMNAAELGFQRGTMYERYDQSEIYVFFSNRQWT
ncbi:MAG TPA: Ig-like domain-containing protein, partial [Nitrolancea sp.]|nr:Ig-like domain-containing protein [Nitrolancea sp.]